MGPSGLGWLQPNTATDLFAKIGLGLIFALIGLTIDQKTLGDTAGRLGFLGWLATLGSGTLLAALLPLGDGLRPVALVVALSSTARSTLLVILRESGEWEVPLGVGGPPGAPAAQCGHLGTTGTRVGGGSAAGLRRSPRHGVERGPGGSGGLAAGDRAWADLRPQSLGLVEGRGGRDSGDAAATDLSLDRWADRPSKGVGGRDPDGGDFGGPGDAPLHRRPPDLRGSEASGGLLWPVCSPVFLWWLGRVWIWPPLLPIPGDRCFG